jgi:uncharacterized protein YndB with AHSA1/START domain
MEHSIISVQTTIDLPVEIAWELWVGPEHVMNWNNASDDWHTPKAANDLRQGGKFNYRMEARDGSMGFDFEGTYDIVIPNDKIEYTIADGRKVIIEFAKQENKTHILETFEAESFHTKELQQQGWQAILDNFKKYAEQNKR